MSKSIELWSVDTTTTNFFHKAWGKISTLRGSKSKATSYKWTFLYTILSANIHRLIPRTGLHHFKLFAKKSCGNLYSKSNIWKFLFLLKLWYYQILHVLNLTECHYNVNLHFLTINKVGWTTVIPEWSSGFPYFLRFNSEFGNKEFMVCATVSSQSCFCWLV